MLDMMPHLIAGQAVGLLALILCVIAFASEQDDRLLIILIFANIAFALQFALFGSWTASGISALIILRILLARKMQGHWPAMVAILVATVAVAYLTWSEPTDLLPLAAGIVGTYAMFMMRGIPMRAGLALAALCWAATNALSGSIGAFAAELLVFATNIFTIARIARGKKSRLTSPGA